MGATSGGYLWGLPLGATSGGYLWELPLGLPNNSLSIIRDGVYLITHPQLADGGFYYLMTHCYWQVMGAT